ncbi:hypothetical protein G9H61_10770 [Aquirufa ecclesiirivi]|uniref:ImmA/IrrE family metallo-endopeptidase n=1 Tax=Aquirufa ecclesiirivi TaxID=2715124 RepID=A0ABT4JI82_9BACT|nr:hypothetical protein [Aquirufa ecclesiirivi]MCZ2475933.1 hypothetical protein [Aquirufa ecclesiirivi]
MKIEELKNIADNYLCKLNSDFLVNNEFIQSQNFTDDENEALINSKDIGLFGMSGIIMQPSFITISEEDCEFDFKSDSNIFDVLGYYSKTGLIEEGKIVLNKKCIEKYAHELSKKGLKLKSIILPYPYDETIYKIVFLHELGHWITHWMLDKDNKRWGDDYWKITPNPNELLEGLAQLFTYQAILIDPDFINLKIIFETMLIGQPEPYHQHSTILKHKYFSWFNVFNALAEIRLESNPTIDSFLYKFNT